VHGQDLADDGSILLSKPRRDARPHRDEIVTFSRSSRSWRSTGFLGKPPRIALFFQRRSAAELRLTRRFELTPPPLNWRSSAAIAASSFGYGSATSRAP